jgi:hypothetical protein
MGKTLSDTERMVSQTQRILPEMVKIVSKIERISPERERMVSQTEKTLSETERIVSKTERILSETGKGSGRVFRGRQNAGAEPEERNRGGALRFLRIWFAL